MIRRPGRLSDIRDHHVHARQQARHDGCGVAMRGVDRERPLVAPYDVPPVGTQLLGPQAPQACSVRWSFCDVNTRPEISEQLPFRAHRLGDFQDRDVEARVRAPSVSGDVG